MNARTFQFRLQSSPGAAAGTPFLLVERLSDGGTWEVQEPGLSTPPFRLHLLSLLLCLRHHLEAEAHERRIPLQRLEATFSAAVSSAWDLQELSASFTLWLDPEAAAEAQARADDQMLAAMQERMRLSPVPRNRPAGVPLHLALRLAR